MSRQSTLAGKVEMVGREPYGGNCVALSICPAGENSGRVFFTPRGFVEADLDYAVQKRSSIHLEKGDVFVGQVEHVMATLEVYGIDNAEIYVERDPSRSYRFLDKLGLASGVEVVPTFFNRQRSLCEEIEKIGVVKQGADRNLIRLDSEFVTDRLSFFPSGKAGYRVKVSTDYIVPGKESFILALGGHDSGKSDVGGEDYKRDISRARPFAKHVSKKVPIWLLDNLAKVAYLNFGFGHGFELDSYFVAPGNVEDWRAQEIYSGEIARHGIMDRLGAIALFGGRFEGVDIEAKFSGHQNDIDVLRALRGSL